MMNVLITGLWWVTSGVLALLVAAAVDLLLMPRSRHHTWRSLLLLYVQRRSMSLVGIISWWRLQGDYARLAEVDEAFVLGTIRQNEDTDYGRDHHFSKIKSMEDFRRMHPVTDYEHFRPYIDRVMNGDTKALFGSGQNVFIFNCTSGTTGSSKFIPSTDAAVKRTVWRIIGALRGFTPEYYFMSNLLKTVKLVCAPRWRYTKNGVKIGPASASGNDKEFLTVQNTTPSKAMVITSEAEALHVGFVLALQDRDVVTWDAGFVFTFWSQLQFLERNWETIVNDISRGKLSSELPISDEHRNIIDGFLSPDKRRAMELRHEFSRGFDAIVPRIFPRLQAVSALGSGSSMALYRKRSAEYLGDIPLVSGVYAASEGMIGVNVRDPRLPPAYALIPGNMFVEFLPVDESGEPEEGAAPLLPSEVRVGGLYEVVLTNASGLYRYRLGDVVSVVGSYHASPTFDFQFRAKQMLNVHMEKVTEAAFTGALRQAVDSWPDHELVEFTTAESVLDPASTGGAPYYLVFLELTGPALPPHQAAEIDLALQSDHYVYKSFRVKEAIGAMRIVRVTEGTFAAFRQHVTSTTQAISQQFKQPRVLRAQEQVQFFLDRAM